MEYLFLTSSSGAPYASAIALKQTCTHSKCNTFKGKTYAPKKKICHILYFISCKLRKKISNLLQDLFMAVIFSSSSKSSASSINRAIINSLIKYFEIFLCNIISFLSADLFAFSIFRNKIFPISPIKQLFLLSCKYFLCRKRQMRTNEITVCRRYGVPTITGWDSNHSLLKTNS